METISLLKKSDLRLLDDGAIELGCNSAYLEKDYHIVQLIKCLQNIRIDNGRIIFTGGTALSKAYQVIERFSEDCDFVLVSDSGYVFNRKKLSEIKKQIKTHLDCYGFDSRAPAARNGNQNVEFSIKYGNALGNNPPEMREELKLEIIYKEQKQFKTEYKNVQSYLARFKQQEPEVESVECLSVEEIAVGKISALIWRYLAEKPQDKTLIRHLYDIASLSSFLYDSDGFKEKAEAVIKVDLEERLKNSNITPKEAVDKLMKILSSNPKCKADYKTYLANFILSKNKMSFEDCLEKLSGIMQIFR